MLHIALSILTRPNCALDRRVFFLCMYVPGFQKQSLNQQTIKQETFKHCSLFYWLKIVRKLKVEVNCLNDDTME